MKTFNYTTHSKQVLGDMHTPVSIYLKVRDMYPQSALMESSENIHRRKGNEPIHQSIPSDRRK